MLTSPMRLHQEIEHYNNLLAKVKKRKLEWYGHITRENGLAKTILQGTIRRGKREEDKGNDGKITSENGRE